MTNTVDFILYDNSTGQIVQDGKIPENALAYQNTDTRTAMVSNGESHSTHYVDLSGDAPAIVKMPDCPGAYYTFDYVTHMWNSDYDLADKAVRAKRAALLAASDWTQLPDVPLETKTAWATYRQALRDITDQAGFPFDITWPTAPNQQ